MRKVCGLLIIVIGFGALGAQDNPLEIMKANDRISRENTLISGMRMVLQSEKGNQKERLIQLASRERGAARDTYIEFIQPADVRGTRFLTLGNPKGEDDQYLFLPALGRVRRIASSGKNGSFMGSDLFYYDLEEQDYRDFRYTLVGEESLGGMSCWVLEAYPLTGGSPYDKSRIWVNKGDYFIYKRQVFENGELWKTFRMGDVHHFGSLLMALKISVVDHRREHRTLLEYRNPQVNGKVDEGLFLQRNLK